ncbi:hypothetical protein LCGC14_1896760 [marine sediment metagenome]|uniref:DUF5131 family protein n=1 Tax=marine sediment metagenome TaxID=412755 RepID=A0A0F9IBL5_9ZZZZ
MPENIDRPMPDNVHLGCSITGKGDLWKWPYIKVQKVKTRFISIEPFLGVLLPSFVEDLIHSDWIIIGRLTGRGHKYDPKREWIETIVSRAKKLGIPLFLKENLKDIWKDKLIQEFPNEK